MKKSKKKNKKKLSQLSERAIHNIIFHFLQDIIKLGALRCGSLCCQHLLKSRADFIAIFTVHRTLDTGISRSPNPIPNPHSHSQSQTETHPNPKSCGMALHRTDLVYFAAIYLA